MYTHPESGRRVTGPTTFTAKTNATQWLSTVETDLHRGHSLDPAGRTVRFGEYSTDWFATKSGLRPKTLELYDYLLRVHILPTFEDVPLVKIDSSSIRVWNSTIRSGSISDTTAAKAYRLFRQILQRAVDDRLVRENPCRVKGAATERSAKRLVPTVDEVMRLTEVIDRRYRAMVFLAAFVGLRRGECFGLARRHLHLNSVPPVVRIERSRLDTVEFGMIFQEPKTLAGLRSIALPLSVADELRAHLESYVGSDPDSLVFTAQRSGDTPTKIVWRRVWDKARLASEVGCTFHDLRHVAGTLNAAAGATIKEAMARLGHASPVASLRYQHALAERDVAIASAVDALLPSRNNVDAEAVD